MKPMKVNFSQRIIIMSGFLLMHKSRVLLEESLGGETLGIKLCIDKQIVKHQKAFEWNQSCHRWETAQEPRFPLSKQSPLQLELFLHQNNCPRVVGEATVSPAVLRRLDEEVKVVLAPPIQLLSYDGLVTGWLYCYFSAQGEEAQGESSRDKFIAMQKINLSFTEEMEEQMTLTIQQNEQLIFQKAFRLNQRSKTLFPNIKQTVRLSDVFRIQLTIPKLVIRPIVFLADHIKRGKNTTFETVLKNRHRQVGKLLLEYYMENRFLENQRTLRTRKAIIPNSLNHDKATAARKIVQRQQRESKEERNNRDGLQARGKLEEADRRFQILKNNIVGITIVEMNGSPPALTKTKAGFSYHTLQSQQKLAFYFQDEKQ